MICPKCKQDVESLTKEHIIPKWISNYDALKYVGIIDTYKVWNDFNAKENIEYLCKPCNNAKNGYLDYNKSVTRKFVKVFANKLLEECEKAEENLQVILKPICQCGTVNVYEAEKSHEEAVREETKKSSQPTLDDIFGMGPY